MYWYEYDEKERIQNVYSKFNLDDFWDFWSSGQHKIMEVRIKDYELIKQTAKQLNIPYSASGVYVSNANLLKKVIAYVRDRATIWFGVNPRKRNWNAYGNKVYGGKDVNIQTVDFIFIDIDRIKKVGFATNEDLKNSDILANKILDRLKTEKWNKGYIKICSGNGVQLLIKLDFPIVMPNVIYDAKTKDFIINDEFEYNKEVVRKGIGAQILRFGRNFKDELMADIDKSGFNIGRVAALPVTKNFKHDGYRWRGIVELEDKANVGLSDYIVSKWEDLKLYKEKAVFGKVRTNIGKDKIKEGKLMKHKLVQFILKPDLPIGETNNKLWFQLKCLLRDSKFDMSSPEYRKFHQKLEKNWKTRISSNLPDKKFGFDVNILNSFFINNLIPPIYDILPHRTERRDVGYHLLDWDGIQLHDDAAELPQDTTIQQDLFEYSNKLVDGDYIYNIEIMLKFLMGCRIKYGEEATRYYYEHLFERYFSYK